MYNNIENIVYRMFQNYYDISANVTSRITSNQQRDISSTYVSILMERIFSLDNPQDISYQTALNDISFSAYRFLPNYYAPTNYTYNSALYRRNYSFIDLINNLSQNYTSEENTVLENFINSTFENTKEKFKKVISDYELEKLKPHIFIKNNETETNCQCPIFCYNFEENEEIIKLPCNHNFNCEGIIKWLTQESNTCPVCRYEFDYKEINSDNKRQTTNNDNNEDNEYNNNEDNEDNDTEYNEYNNEEFDAEFIQSNNISEDEIILQEILYYTYSNTNNTNNTNNTIT